MTWPLVILLALSIGASAAILWHAWRRTGLEIEAFCKDIAGFCCVLGLAAIVAAAPYLLSW